MQAAHVADTFVAMRYVTTQLRSLRIVHDASGKVVVRQVASDNSESVIAIAQWKDDATTERRQLKRRPKPSEWAEIDELVRGALRSAASMGPDGRLDAATLPGDPIEVKPEPKLGTLQTIWGVIVIIAVGVGLFFAWPYIRVFVDKSGSANGEVCKFDRDCRSGVCDYGRCAAGKRPRGDRCDMDSQCASGECRKSLCD